MNSGYRLIYPDQFLSPASILQRLLAQERPDLVEVCDKYCLNYMAALLRESLLRGVNVRPAVVGLSCERMDDNVQSYVPHFPWKRALSLSYVRRPYFPFFDFHIANSVYTAEELKHAGAQQLTPRSVWVRPMGVDFSLLTPARRDGERRLRLLDESGARRDGVLLLYVGRLVPEKNLGRLFALIEQLARISRKDYRLLVVGDGIERQQWERKTALSMPGRVRFFGHARDRVWLANLYANADVFVHPNPREPFGIAPLEAMASGVPGVLPNRGGVLAYANQQNSWTAEPTVAAFAAAVEEVVENQALREQKVRHALRTAEHYRWENVAAEFLDLYDEFCRIRRGESATLAPDFTSSPASEVQKTALRLIGEIAKWGHRLGPANHRVHGEQREQQKATTEPFGDAAF